MSVIEVLRLSYVIRKHTACELNLVDDIFREVPFTYLITPVFCSLPLIGTDTVILSSILLFDCSPDTCENVIFHGASGH